MSLVSKEMWSPNGVEGLLWQKQKPVLGKGFRES